MAITEKQQRFIEDIAKHVQKYARAYGILVHSPIIAQAILESGWGESKLAAKYHNYFGLKCGSKWTGKSVNLTTQEEYQPGTLTTIKDNFRVYDSMEEGVKGYFEFIQLQRYQNLRGITDPKEYLQTIKNDGYATSSTYVENNYQLITQYKLTEYDKEGAEMSKIEKAVQQMEAWAGDDSHGYDQTYRWGQHGDLSSSSLLQSPIIMLLRRSYFIEFQDFMIAICVLSTSISMIFPSFIAIFNLRYLFSASDLSQARTCEALLVPIRQLDFHSDSHCPHSWAHATSPNYDGWPQAPVIRRADLLHRLRQTRQFLLRCHASSCFLFSCVFMPALLLWLYRQWLSVLPFRP